MKILFVGRAKAGGDVGPILYAQGKSLEKQGFEVDYYPIKDAGFKGYLTNIKKLRTYIKQTNPAIIHAHYSLTGFVVSLATSKPVVGSLMGSFPKKNLRYFLVQWFITFFWDATIVKSERTAIQLKRKNLHIIPNGVDLELFTSLDKLKLREKLLLKNDIKYILFAADPSRVVKNYSLAEAAVKLINDTNVQLLVVHNKPQESIAEYMCAADVLLLTSLSEGSPNVIKEAMASGIPIVTTDVGDVTHLLAGLEGAFISGSFNAAEIAALLQKALLVEKTDGLNRIKALKLDSICVAKRLSAIYENIRYKKV